jgi:DUF1009 family protein
VKLGVLAGGGPYPRRIADAWTAQQGREAFIVCLRDFAEPATFQGYPLMVERVGAGGAIVERLRAEGVTHVVLSGQARRPSLLALWPDAWTAKLLARMGKAAFLGDDTLLRAIAAVLREEGFEVVSPHSILGAVLEALAAQDVGQAVVVQQGLILGIEAIEGTDALLERAGAQRREGPGGVLVKLPKRGQDMRLDPPVIGPATIANAAAAGLRGVAIEAGGTAIADRAEALERTAAHGLFLLAVESASFTP